MKAIIARIALVALFALGGSGAALAAGDCGINSNKPCPPPENTFSKEKAYKSMNSNQPTAQQADPSLTRKTDDTPVRADVQAKAGEETAAKATLTGVSASDLKVKPKPPKSSAKEPAGSIP
jgi:hypothetical protein